MTGWERPSARHILLNWTGNLWKQLLPLYSFLSLPAPGDGRSAGTGKHDTASEETFFAPERKNSGNRYCQPVLSRGAKGPENGFSETDSENRRVILNYMEHFRMSYETKDIDFLEQLFSEKALIIVGTVVKQLPQEGHYLPADQIRYNIKRNNNIWIVCAGYSRQIRK